MNTEPIIVENRSKWAHRCAWLLACATFPLIWVGGLVTTTDAGMAFRDWLTSDGYWMPFYPWFSSAGDKFVEHGHRLLGMTAGLLSIVLVLVTWRTEPRSWVRKFSFVILAGVILQGVIGGMRVVMDQRTLALIHGCTGPLFFALCAAMVVFTSRWWQNTSVEGKADSRRKVLRLSILCVGMAYAQLVVGAVVRHSPYMLSETAGALFQSAVYLHILLALLIVGHVLLLAWRCFRNRLQVAAGIGLVALVAVQLFLGLGTWLVKYGLPNWATNMFGEMAFVNREADFLQAAIITSHAAVGSLIFVSTLVIALRFAKQLGVGVVFLSMSPSLMTEVTR